MVESIMVVEDREPIAEVLRDMLMANGFSVVALATTGKEAVEMFTKERPGIVIMDLLLPDMSGLEVTTRLIEIDPSVKVIAITALSRDGLIEDALNAGCVRFMTKPFRIKELVGTIREISSP